MTDNLSKDELISFFEDGCKNKKKWRIGTEHEKFGFIKQDLKPIVYEDINKIFQSLSERFSWEKVFENNYLIALKKKKSSITLEPGGQIELSGSPKENLFETCREVNEHQKELSNVCEELGIDFMGMGVLPKWDIKHIPLMPKRRYEIMRSYMPTVGSRGIDMMKRTSTIQANFDYSSEKDMIKKFRVSQSLQPVIVALYANSPFLNGRLTEYLSYRSYIWTQTDSNRCGVLPFVYDSSFSFERYVDYLIKVPMYFIIRDGKYTKISGYNFGDFLDGKIKEIKNEIPQMSDWINHISTVFPEVRLKSYIELRGADGGPWSRVCALPAFWTGILYDENVLDETYHFIQKWSFSDVNKFYMDVRENGLKAYDPNGAPLFKTLKNLLDLSTLGLKNRKVFQNKEDESIFLFPLKKILESQKSPAETWKNLFLSEWNENIDNIYEANYFKILEHNEKI